MSTIQWFPGHMAKAKREVTEKLKLVDVVYELLDARVPLSSRNPLIDEIVREKPRILLLNKADLADPEKTERWLDYFRSRNMTALAINSQTGRGIAEIPSLSKKLVEDKFAKMRAKGLRPRPVRGMVLGIPNSGKSTLINRLAGRNAAKTGNVPGVTKSQQWIKVGPALELLDTPGILWPKFDDPEAGYKLALTGAIKDSVLNLQDIAAYAINFLQKEYPARLADRYKLEQVPEDLQRVFDEIGKKRGCLMAGGQIDYDKTAEVIVRDVRSNKLGPLTFDLPPS